MLKLEQETALNLSLEGSVGTFNVGKGHATQQSLEVKYFLTHVGLDFSSGSNEQLLKHLAPVREIFDFKSLDFDEIMQRDIDDARVSGELVPYLLDSKSHDLIKLFPPIIVVVLPVKEDANRPDSLYPAVKNEHLPAASEDTQGKLVLRAGAVGAEVFQFEQPVFQGAPLNHDLVRLRINTNKSRLVIVDGQHRAMALLAIYRNLKDDWSDERRAPFKEYYEEWTKNFIGTFSLKKINLPVMFCTFPNLCEGYTGDFDLKQAARMIFLTLNKTARKVSTSRNILLDDKDLIASFLRQTLSGVKAKDSRSPKSFRIWNVELDQFSDRLKVQNPIAITGVNHVYYIIEHLLLNEGDGDINGAKPRSGKFYKRADLENYGAMSRLNGRDTLGSEKAENTKRYNFSMEAAEKLGEAYEKNYGAYIVSAFETFMPYEIHNKAVLQLNANLEANEDRKLRPIIFEGQGINRVFEEHRRNLRTRLDENDFETDVPQIEALAQRLDYTKARMEKAISNFKDIRANSYIEGVSEKSKLKLDSGELQPKVIKFFNDLYDNVFSTVAFEAALVCGFFGSYEKAKKEALSEGLTPSDIDTSFKEYIDQLTEYFVPTTLRKFKKLVGVFVGDFEGEISEWKVIPSPHTFRAIAYRGEMQPDQWPKYKFLLHEIWSPTDKHLSDVVEKEREKSRIQIFTSLYEHNKTDYARQNAKHEDTLDAPEKKQVFDTSYKAFSDFLKLAGKPVSEIPAATIMQHKLEGIPNDAETTDQSSEEWTSEDS